MSIQRKVYYEKNKSKLLRKQNDRYKLSNELVRTFVELDNILNALEETTDNESSWPNDSENNQFFRR